MTTSRSRMGGVIVRAAVAEECRSVAVIVTLVCWPTDLVGMVKVAVAAPAATLTWSGTVALVLLLVSVTRRCLRPGRDR